MKCRFFSLSGTFKVINFNTYAKIDRETKQTKNYYEPPERGKLQQ